MTKQEKLHDIQNTVQKHIESLTNDYIFNFEGFTNSEIIRELKIIITEAYHDGVLSYQDAYTLNYIVNEYNFLYN